MTPKIDDTRRQTGAHAGPTAHTIIRSRRPSPVLTRSELRRLILEQLG